MTKFKSRPMASYQAFLVEPGPDFEPRCWRDRPQSYRVLEYAGTKRFLGRADAWRFLHNHNAIQRNDFRSWAIIVD